MQINTTGYLMELFLDTYIFLGMSFSILANLFFLIVIHRLLKAANKVIKTELTDLEDIRVISTHILSVYDLQKDDLEKLEEINRSILELRDLLGAIPTMKPNNWDGVREAFKRPGKVEVDVRN
jgi:hypothetical protein